MTLTKYILAGCILIMLLITGIFIINILSPEEDVLTEASLRVDEVYFVTKELEGEDYKLETFAFITNNGEKDCEVNIRAFAVDVNTNLAMDEDSTTVGTIEGQKTEEASLTVEVPKDGKYRVELLVFKDGKVTVKGSGVVNLQLAGTGGQDYRTSDSEEPPEMKKETDSDSPTIFNFIGIILIVGVYIIYVKRRRGQ